MLNLYITLAYSHNVYYKTFKTYIYILYTYKIMAEVTEIKPRKIKGIMPVFASRLLTLIEIHYHDIENGIYRIKNESFSIVNSFAC